MECIHCTQCADACDAIMTRVGKPTGLIRYTTRDALEGRGRHALRPRTVLYPAALALFLAGLGWALHEREETEVTILRGIGAPFLEEADGRIANQLRIKLANKSDHAESYRLEIAGVPEGTVIAPENPLRVPAGRLAETSVFVLLPRSAFANGERRVTVRVSDGVGYRSETPYRLVGPRAPSGPTRPEGTP